MKHFFYKGEENILTNIEVKPNQDLFDIILDKTKNEISKIIETRNLSFLIGSGCSLGEFGIPTMQNLADLFFDPSEKRLENCSDKLKTLLLKEEHIKILEKHKIDYSKEPFRNNLEVFLGTLFSIKFYFEQINDEEKTAELIKVISQTKNYILHQCLNEDNQGKDDDIFNNYKNFYRKLSLRDSNLPKPNVFTTNYDLYSEKSMDELGITYANGFSGFIERYFNPAIFNYALAEQMDISSFKWNVIDNFIYLFKIHGSVNWIEVEETNKLFRVRELQNVSYKTLKKQKNLMIYPSPIKQNASLGSPYSDLFREFQKRITRNQSVLVTMGYSFADEHINNIIYQALTIPTFRLVIFSDINQYFNKEVNEKVEEGESEVFQIKETIRTNIEKLKKLNDPRIWIIGSDEEFKDNTSWEKINNNKGLHFFNTITNELLPDWIENKVEVQNEKILKLFDKAVEDSTKE